MDRPNSGIVLWWGSRRVVSGLLERFRKTTKPSTTLRVAWYCVLAPDAVVEPEVPVRLAEFGAKVLPTDGKRSALRACLRISCSSSQSAGALCESLQYLRACILTPRAADLRGLDALTADNCGAGRRLASHAASKFVPQRFVNPVPGPIVAPAADDPVNCFPVRRFVGQKSPGTATAHNIDDRVDDGATANRPGRPSTRSGRQKFSKNVQLFVGEVREILRSFRVGHRYDSFRSMVGNRGDSYRFLLIW
jgi:hypothetical protein